MIIRRRRVQYGSGTLVFLLLMGTGIYFGFFCDPASCFDKEHNSDERGADCGGSCVRICSFDVFKPTVL